MIDNFKHKGQRIRLVETLMVKGIKDKNVLKAIGKIPRHLFVESYLESRAYKDEALPIGYNQTISQPYTVAFQTQLLDVKKGDKILEIGTGSGYQVAVLTEMGAKVYSIERQKQLYLRTCRLFAELNYHSYLKFGDGFEGLKGYSPFDKIIITAGAPKIPQTLLTQLQIGGRMVIPLDAANHQIMSTIDRVSENEFKKQEFGNFLFVPMLKGVAK